MNDPPTVPGRPIAYPAKTPTPTQAPPPQVQVRVPARPIPAPAVVAPDVEPAPVPVAKAGPIPASEDSVRLKPAPNAKNPFAKLGHRSMATTTSGSAVRVTPTERIDPNGGTHLSDLWSKASPDLAAPERRDPFYDQMWAAGAQRPWVTKSHLDKQTPFNPGPYPKAFRVETAEATEKFFTMHHSRSAQTFQSRLSLLGVIHGWRTVTTEQAAAFVGDPSVRAASKALVSNLFATGAVDIGRYSTVLGTRDRIDHAAMLRPAGGSHFSNNIEPRLTWAEWLSITGGREWGAYSLYSRHNVLTTELALRYAEYSDDVIAVLGERFCTVDLLAGAGAGLPAIASDKHAADAALIRRDGARIAIEMVATASSYLNRKVEWWAKLLSETSSADSGLSVVFVVAEDPDMKRNDTRPALYQAINRAVRKHPGPVRNRTAERIGVVAWTELFPGRHMVSEDFFNLRVDRPTGPTVALWEVADAMDPKQVPGPDEAHKKVLLSGIGNISLLGQTPRWFRDARLPAGADLPDFGDLLLQEAGLNAVPQMTGTHPNRDALDGIAEAKGAAGPAALPRRLSGLSY